MRINKRSAPGGLGTVMVAISAALAASALVAAQPAAASTSGLTSRAQTSSVTPAWLAPTDLTPAGQTDSLYREPGGVVMNATGDAVLAWIGGSDRADTNEIRAAWRGAGGSWDVQSVVTVTNTSGGYSAAHDNNLSAPKVAIDDAGDALVVWSQTDGIHSSFRPAGVGAAWHASLVTTYAPPEGVQAPEHFSLALDKSGNAIVAWSQNIGSESEAGVPTVAYRPAGADSTWSSPEVVSAPAGDTDQGSLPAVQFDAQGNALLVWAPCRGGTYPSCSGGTVAAADRPHDTGTFGTNTFGASQDFGPYDNSQNWDLPDTIELAVGPDGSAAAAWTEGWDPGYLAYRPAGQSTFDAPTPNLTADELAIDSAGNALAVNDGSTVYQAYDYWHPAGPGRSWSPVSDLGPFSGESPYPTSVAFDGQGQAVMVGVVQNGGTVASVRGSGAAGTYGPLATLSSPGDYVEHPLVAADGQGDAIAAWTEQEGSNYVMRVAGYAAGPALLSLDVPASVTQSADATFSVDPNDVWNSVADSDVIWTFTNEANSSDTVTATGPSVHHSFPAAGTYDVSVQATDSAGNVVTSPVHQVTVTPPLLTVATTSVDGHGSGAVVSATPGSSIACNTGLDVCSESVAGANGKPGVENLNAIPAVDSFLSAWTGCDGNTLQVTCQVTVSQATTVTAYFETCPVSHCAAFTGATQTSPPQDVTATPADGDATITFAAPADTYNQTVTSYVVTAHLARDGANAKDDQVISTAIVGPVTFSGLANGNQYDISVVAKTATSLSDPATTTVVPSPPGVVLTADNTSITAGQSVDLKASANPGTSLPAGATFTFYCGDSDTAAASASAATNHTCTFYRESPTAGWNAYVTMFDPTAKKSYQATVTIHVAQASGTVDDSAAFAGGQVGADIIVAPDGSLTSSNTSNCGASVADTTCVSVAGSIVRLTAAPGTFTQNSRVQVYQGDPTTLKNELGSNFQTTGGFAVTWTPRTTLKQPLIVSIQAGAQQTGQIAHVLQPGLLQARDVGNFFAGIASAFAAGVVKVATTVGSAVSSAANAVSSLWQGAHQSLVKPNGSSTNNVLFCASLGSSGSKTVCNGPFTELKDVSTEEIAALDSGDYVIAAGGGNVIAAGGGNVIAAGGGNVIAAGGGNVIAAGGGNLNITGASVIAAGGGNVIAAGGGNVIAAGGGNVIAAGGGNVIAAGGGNVIAAGGGNLTFGLTADPGIGFVTPEQTTPPTVTATTTPQAPGSGVFTGPVSVHLAATGAAGTGIQNVSYSATGAQTIANTTVAGDSADVTIDAAGTTTITYTAEDVDLNDAVPQTITVQIEQPTAQTITFPQPTGMTYGDADQALAATASSTLTVAYAAGPSSVCTVASGKLHVVGAGSCSVAASQPGDAQYAAADDVTDVVTIAQKALTITASDATMQQGGSLPAVTPSYAGLVAGDSAPATPPTCAADPGAKTTVCTGAVDPNYAITYVAGTLTVTAPPNNGGGSGSLPAGWVPAGGSSYSAITDGTPPSEAVMAGVRTPNAGVVTFTPTTPSDTQAGYSILGHGFVISAPTASPGTPLQLMFAVADDALPAGADPMSLAVFRDGVLVQPCATDHATTADPDPCVSGRQSGNGSTVITVLSSHASTWTFGVRPDYVASGPTRILDTRNGTGAVKAPVGPKGTITLSVPNLPAGTSAVVLNLTGTGLTGAGTTFVSACPAAQKLADCTKTSVLNVMPGQSVPNEITVPVASDGRITLYNNAGHLDLVADLVGYETGGYAATGPTRILDTRAGTGAAQAPVGPKGTITLTVPNLPAGTSAVTVNLTATGLTGTPTSYVSACPAAQKLSDCTATSALNATPGQDVANEITVPVAPDGRITLYNNAGHIDLVADLVGYTTSGYTTTNPTRILDTRTNAPVFANSTLTLTVPNLPAGTSAVTLNLTATGLHQAAQTYISACPAAQKLTDCTTTSVLNASPGQDVANEITVPVAPDGQITLYNHTGWIDLVADLVGYHTS